ncbi:MAG: TetR family transcriptional regulator [marine bacterium B5-7]|nr:MAG: TetR family transcriptional regulator [marine bacterium B5-7]
MQQFWRAGYEATSLQDLLDVMNLSKSSLYQTYGSKHELFLRSIDCYQQVSVDELQQCLNDSLTSKAFMKRLLEGVIAEVTSKKKKGCLLVNTVNELSHKDKMVSKAVLKGFDNIAAVIKQAITRGKKEGAITSTVNTDVLVSYIVSNVSGLRTMVKSGANKNELVPLVNMIMKTVY